MNRSLFISWYAALFVTIVVASCLWLIAIGAAPGTGFGSNESYVLWSGWIAFVLLVVVTIYSLRKRIHQLHLSPETRRRVPVRSLERAEVRLNELRAEVLKGKIRAKRDVRARAKRALREERVSRVVRAIVEVGQPGGAPFLIQTVPREPLGRMATWLHAHLYLGLAFAVVAWLHGGGSLGSPLGATMNLLTWIVLGTGLLGVVLFAVGPRWITEEERDLSFEKAFVLTESLAGKLEECFHSLDPGSRLIFRSPGEFPADFHTVTEESIKVARRIGEEERSQVESYLTLLQQRRRVARIARKLSRIKFWMNVWRAVHVPASVVLVGAVVLHVLSIWWY